MTTQPTTPREVTARNLFATVADVLVIASRRSEFQIEIVATARGVDGPARIVYDEVVITQDDAVTAKMEADRVGVSECGQLLDVDYS